MNILVTGAAGQIGTELVPHLRAAGHRVYSTDLREDRNERDPDFSRLDVTDMHALLAFLQQKKITQIYHLAAILSGRGEQNPQLAFRTNMDGVSNILEAARLSGIQRIFVPSSIAVFGPDAPRLLTPNETTLRPQSMYGITKVAGELLQEYYAARYAMDIRSLRFPGIVSHAGAPGGGTTDFAIELIRQAVAGQRGQSFLAPATTLPFLYMPDVLRAIDLYMGAPEGELSRTVYNLTGFSASPQEIAFAIRRYVPAFEFDSKPDHRQVIADSWPESIDDSLARGDWGWRPEYGLEETVADMIGKLSARAPGVSRPPGSSEGLSRAVS